MTELELELLTPPPASVSASGCVGLPAATLIYSVDGRYVFQRQAHVLRVLHAKSGRVLHECVRASNKSAVRALALHPHNALQLLAAYEDGKIVVWDFVEQKLLVELDAKAPVLWMGASRTSPSQLLLVVSDVADIKDENGWSLVEFSLKKKRRGRVLLQHRKLPFQSAAMQSYTQQDEKNTVGDYLVLAAGAKLFAVSLQHKQGAKDSSNRVFTTQKLTHIRDVTCVAVHPTQREFSIGDAQGQIFRYHQQGKNEDAIASAAKMHWHSHAVHCIQYSSDGQFLLSGGEECVLVSWHLETGRRAYLPRLPAAVDAIAPRQDGGVYVVGLADSVLFQYNPVTREQEWEARGLARAGGSAKDSLPSRQLKVDPRSKALVLNGSSGAGVLQFYEPFADRVLQTLLLSERNQVTRTEDEVLPLLQASHTNFSSRGGDLVTLHAPTTATNGEDQALRFWTRRVDGSFFVNTAVDAPHGRASVTSVAFSPTSAGDCVVTADEQGDFKVWQKSATAAGGASWHCQSVLTLWDVVTHSLRRVIPSADGQIIRQIVFPGASSPFVVVVTDGQVQVWSLLTLSLWWRYTVPQGSVVSEETLHERFLVWLPLAESSKDSKKSLVLAFDPQTPVPTCIRAVDLGTDLWSAGFHPGTGDIVLIDGETGVWRLDGPNARSLDARRRKEAHVAAVAVRTATKDGEQEAQALSSIYNAASSNHISEEKKNKSKHVGADSAPAHGSASNGLFDAPAHVLPSMTALYRSFMDTMLPKPHQVTEGDNELTKDGDKQTNEDGSSNSRKKKNKRRKKMQQQQQQQQLTVEDPSANENGEQRKRMKLQVEKELANPALQQQTYSKLLEAFRNSKARRA
ncbi:hypothetical protein BBO99_00002680 [Phytophthora kernoviae]|uniref:WD repeat-containing protein 75 second beta-propeller domain-containing protein n=2 Tax=Phytophthora kernoviae TaxID=325452 RepID=A0A3R7JCB3_9STRA|nr:hypothetical protein G195_003827 [Phytophthora kernoviae 00238/432]KAG2527927.1 hypothetical protein JM16_002405 [Phytophthora kernoviae]RLN36659.1 hypothetical protein BBI17_002681 [Phytophthora kernoviae]RLN82717.1 hypothetical protein BBO99_00002680 [Phytophthora kernoviae]